MSDYLGDLAARSLARTDVILPRLASRFESAPGMGIIGRGGPSVLDDGWTETEGDTENVDSRPQAPAFSPARPVLSAAEQDQSRAEQSRYEAGKKAVVPRRAPAVRDSGLETIAAPTVQMRSSPRESLGMTEKVAGAASVEGVPLPHSRPLPGPQRDDLATRFEPTRGEAVEPLVRSLPAQDDHTLAERIRSAVGDILVEQRAEELGEDPVRVDRSAIHAPSLERDPAAGRRVSAAEAPRTEAQPAVQAPIIARPQVAIALPATPAPTDAATSRQQAAQQHQPTPTIQVTIGRIEIRATPAPATTATRKPKPSPVVSLEDYLRQRNGNGR